MPKCSCHEKAYCNRNCTCFTLQEGLTRARDNENIIHELVRLHIGYICCIKPVEAVQNEELLNDISGIQLRRLGMGTELMQDDCPKWLPY